MLIPALLAGGQVGEVIFRKLPEEQMRYVALKLVAVAGGTCLKRGLSMV